MVVCADTSFLFSLYGNDENSPRAISWVKSHRKAITISCLNEFELQNALRFAECRQLLPSGASELYFSQFESDKKAGRLSLAPLNLASVVDLAKKLSASHTLSRGHRAFDILQVAAGMILQAKTFLTFDGNQKELAVAEGLIVPW